MYVSVDIFNDEEMFDDIDDDDEFLSSVMVWSESMSSNSVVCVDAWDGLRMRSSPSCDAPVITLLQDGTRLTRIGTTQKSSCGYTWYNVQYGGTVGWVASSFLKSCGGGSGGGSGGNEDGGDRGARIVAFARAQIGKRYVWAGNGPDEWDCSGLVKAAYAQVGIDVPRATSAYPGPNLKPTNTPKVGDVVGHSNHVAIYAGNNMVIHAMDVHLGIRMTELNQIQMAGPYTFWTPRW